EPAAAYEIYVAQRPDAVVLGADLPRENGQHLAQRLRATDARLIVLVADKGHLGKAKGVQSVLDLRANAYVADPTKKELIDRIGQLIAQAQAGRQEVPASKRGIALVLDRSSPMSGECRVAGLARALQQLWGTFRDGILVGPE